MACMCLRHMCVTWPVCLHHVCHVTSSCVCHRCWDYWMSSVRPFSWCWGTCDSTVILWCLCLRLISEYSGESCWVYSVYYGHTQRLSVLVWVCGWVVDTSAVCIYRKFHKRDSVYSASFVHALLAPTHLLSSPSPMTSSTQGVAGSPLCGHCAERQGSPSAVLVHWPAAGEGRGSGAEASPCLQHHHWTAIPEGICTF